jgi:hypothetical protein
MDVRRDRYWSIETCSWVAITRPEAQDEMQGEAQDSADLPAQRPAEEPDRAVDLDDVDQPLGAPV